MSERDAQPLPSGLTPVSPRLTSARLLVLAIAAVVAGAGVAATTFFAPRWVTVALSIALIVALVWVGLVIARQVRHIGYATRDDDLLIARGVMFRTTTVVPYGRMQYVEVSSGPIARMFDLATLELHTASASSDATIPGMPRHDAEALRDRLAALGEAHLAGL